MRTRSQKIEEPSESSAVNREQLPVVPNQEENEVEKETQNNEKPCSSRNMSTIENSRASSTVINAAIIENVDTNSPCSSGTSSGVICISDSEDSDILNPVCVDLTNAQTPNKPRAALNNTVIELDDSDDDVEARPPAQSLNSTTSKKRNAAAARENAPELTSSPKKQRKRPKIVLKELVTLDNEPPKKKKPEQSQDSVFSCNICMETHAEMKQTNKKIVSTPCGHVFCRPCLEMAAKSLYGRMPGPTAKVNSCPKCRAKYSFNQLIELFV